jgi:hypothetical protein
MVPTGALLADAHNQAAARTALQPFQQLTPSAIQSFSEILQNENGLHFCAALDFLKVTSADVEVYPTLD